ncbi:MAG: ABC transporter ATP-binding protein [Rhodospirillaceae bacterium]|nr:ABC transporter ATP-binding protein [Rhodospirillaceae bacterium]MCA8931738.1 ABC transporter ATP-binding protein [Rhodospirillaceae bacterium]
MQIQGLRSGYGGKPVLQGIDLEVGKGEIVAVIGRNGVGKSTLMRALMGLLPATAGQILIDDKDVTQVSPHKRARMGIGYIPQGRDVFPRMTVAENLAVGETLLKPGTSPDYDRIYQYFPVLKERASQRAGTLSGGQQQQLAIARVLVGRPNIILLDEPSEGIQPNIVQDIARNVRDLNRELGLTVLFVEQNLDMIMLLAQHCFVIDKGQIVARLSAEDLNDPDAVRRYLAL